MADIPYHEHVILKSGAQIKNFRAGLDTGDTIIAVMKYVTASNDYQFYNGTKWVSMSGFKSVNKNSDTTDTFGVLEGLSSDGASYEFRSIKKGSSKISLSNSSGIITIDLGTVAISDITGLQAALDNKVDKIAGKGLSTEDFTTAFKDKLNSVIIVKKATPNTDQSASYQLQATFGGSTQVLGADIDIPKDMFIQSGIVATVTVADQPYTGAVVGEKYIDILLANSANTHIYIPAKSLVDVYTGSAGTEITVAVNNTTNVITATINDGSIVLSKLSNIELGTITASSTQATTTSIGLLSILQSFASNIKQAFLDISSILNKLITLGLSKRITFPITGQSGTITFATHGVVDPMDLIFKVNGVTAYIYTAIDPSTKAVSWSSQTNFIAGDNATLTIIG